VTITTSKQLAEALGPRFQPFAAMAGACAPLDGGPQEVIVEPWNGLFRAIGPSGVVSLDADPRAADPHRAELARQRRKLAGRLFFRNHLRTRFRCGSAPNGA
jgi:hypothetical protein